MVPEEVPCPKEYLPASRRSSRQAGGTPSRSPNLESKHGPSGHEESEWA